MDCDELAQHAVVTDDGPCLFAFELQVLGHGAYHGGWEDMTVVTDDDIVVDISESVDGHILADLCFRTNICKW